MLSLVVMRSRDLEKLAKFYSALGLCFVRHQHGIGPEHLSSQVGETVFEIYPTARPEESTVAIRLGFSVPSLTIALNDLLGLNAVVVAEPSDTPFGRRAVVKDFEGHKVELYEEKPSGE